MILQLYSILDGTQQFTKVHFGKQKLYELKMAALQLGGYMSSIFTTKAPVAAASTQFGYPTPLQEQFQ
jgi:hypothetical protein